MGARSQTCPAWLISSHPARTKKTLGKTRFCPILDVDMRTNQISQQAFNDARVARNANIDDTVTMERGEPWAKNLAIVCPGCGVVFYGYQCQTRKQEDGYMDPEPPIVEPGMVDGRRRTCGHPSCEAGEDRHQMERSHAYAKTRDDYFAAKANEDHGLAKPKYAGLKRL